MVPRGDLNSYFEGSFSIEPSPVDDQVGEVVVVLDLRTLAEVLSIVHRQMVDVKRREKDVVGFTIDTVEIEPEELPRGEALVDELPGCCDRVAIAREGSLH